LGLRKKILLAVMVPLLFNPLVSAKFYPYDAKTSIEVSREEIGYIKSTSAKG